MRLKPKTRRLLVFITMGGLLAGGVTLVLQAFRENLIFFYTPSEFTEAKRLSPGKVRLGGLVAEGSFRREGATAHFSLTDRKHSLPICYTGLLPNLFREGQGVVVEGYWSSPQHFFQATVVLAKHDEVYRAQKARRP